MELKIERAKATIFNVEGFPSAKESAERAENRFNRVMDKIVDEGFIEAALKRAYNGITSCSEEGDKVFFCSGWGCPESQMLATSNEEIRVKKYLIEKHIIPFLRENGYRCGEVKIKALPGGYNLSYDILW